ncbi:MAG: FtsX-like permease family protein [Campylobacterota bacterium]|nr:FtsX-like permease family protein [Campylobacterota bacterium]
MNSTFLNFLTLLLFKHRNRHLAILIIATLLLALLSSVLFISSSINSDIKTVLKEQSDFTLQRFYGGKQVDMPQSWQYDIEEIAGVDKVTPRVYGTYYIAPGQEHFLIVGVDFFDAQSSNFLKTITDNLNLKEFLQKDSMYISNGIKKFLKERYYEEYFEFRLRDGSIKKVAIADTFSNQSNIISNDMIIMPIDLAREILGVNQEYLTDLSFNVPNEAEWDNIKTKLHLMHFDIRVLTRNDISTAYQNLFNYKGGIFLVLFLITTITFMLILYQRYFMVYSSEKKEIGIMRAVGWSINDILKLKFFETLILILFSYALGILIAYIYVFILNAPLLQNIFLGSANLSNSVTFAPAINMGVLSSLFLLFAVPFMAAVLIPVWRVAIIEPKEAMK